MGEPLLPAQFPHIFVEVVFQVVPEVDYGDLCYLSEIAKIKGETDRYRALVDALRKVQWAKLGGLQAVAIEAEMEKRLEELGPKSLLAEPIGQIYHAKAIFDFVAHAKAAVDSMAVFVTHYFAIDAQGGNRDFRRAPFRDKILQADPVVGAHVQTLAAWFNHRSGHTDSLIAVRDEWVHRGSPGLALVLPRSEVGLLPIPRKIETQGETSELPVLAEHFWSTPGFTEFHFGRVVGLFIVLVKRCIEVETASLRRAPKRAATAGPSVSAVAFRLTEPTLLNKIGLGRRTTEFLGESAS